MNLFKLRRRKKFIRVYEGRRKGTVVKDITYVKLAFLGLPFFTLRRYKRQYNGDICQIKLRSYELA